MCGFGRRLAPKGDALRNTKALLVIRCSPPLSQLIFDLLIDLLWLAR